MPPVIRWGILNLQALRGHWVFKEEGGFGRFTLDIPVIFENIFFIHF
jgi:hypothetical protein